MSKAFDWEIAAKRWKMPSVCPVCGSKLVLNKKHTELFCDNLKCKAKLIARVHTWTRLLKAKQWAPVTIEKFIDEGLVDSVASLYTLDYGKIAALEGFGEKSAETLEKNLKKTKDIQLSTFIAGFNIGGIGEKTIKKELQSIGTVSLSEIFNVKLSEFIIEGIGTKTAEKLYKGLQALKDDMLEAAKYVNVLPHEVTKEKKPMGKFSGLTFCFTGASTDGTKRSALEKMVEERGGSVTSVNKKLSYLVASETGTGKAKKAAELGIKVLTYDEFFEMV